MAVHRKDPLLFWVIVGVASRKPAISPLARQLLEGVSYIVLMKEIKSMVANLLITPVRTLGIVQALLLLCEWQVPQTGEWEGRGWLYCGVVSSYKDVC